MNALPSGSRVERRVLLLLPTPRDAELTQRFLADDGIAAHPCADSDALAQAIDEGAGAVVVAEEYLANGALCVLTRALEDQPSWSDLPVLVVARVGTESGPISRVLEQLGNASLLDRPLRIAALTSAARTALRAREHQYQIRQQLTDLERAHEELATAARLKDEFLAMLGHELRNPLAPIRNALQLLSRRADDAPGPATGELVPMMRRQVDHMVRLVDDLVDVSRVSRGTIELRREHVDLADVIAQAVDLSRPLMEAKGHALELDICADPMPVHADPVRLAQVFSNLLNNAAKYSPDHSRIRLQARCEGEVHAVTVCDDGIGIDPEALPRIFDLFTQGKRGIHRAQDGLGVGLSLVKRLVSQHGGRVAASSAGLGAGSTFKVWLPASEVGPRAVEHATPELRGSDTGSLRVMVVDDNVDAARTLGMLLEALGVRATVAFNGADALELAATSSPHIVFLDIGMPHMDGYEVARAMRSAASTRQAVLVALTGWSQPEDQARTRAAGFDHHMSKPADLASLQALLASARPDADTPTR